MNAQTRPKDPSRNRSRGDANSAAAFQSLIPTLTKTQADILTTVRSQKDGMTLDEYCDEKGISPNQVSGRFTTLCNKRHLMKEGKRRTRSGRLAAVYHSTV